MSNHRLVYSTDDGDRRREQPGRKPTPATGPVLPNDGVVRVFREKGRPELAKYLQKLRDQAIIEWKNDDLKKAYDIFLAKPPVPPANSN